MKYPVWESSQMDYWVLLCAYAHVHPDVFEITHLVLHKSGYICVCGLCLPS